MRIVLALSFWIIFVGGLAVYMDSREVAHMTSTVIAEKSPGTVQEVYDLEITPSFNLVSDPFALQTDDSSEASALVVRLGRRELFRLSGREDSGGIIRIDNIEGLVAGENEIYAEAAPPMEDPFLFHAMRLRVLQNEKILAEKTLWAPPGSKISGTLSFETQPPSSTFNEDSSAHERH